MAPSSSRDSLATIAAIGLIAMCVVSFDHEALGHGGACLALGGRVELLTVSLFRCDQASPVIDAAGPLSNLLLGGLALGLSTKVPLRRAGLRLFLVLVAAFSLFWEGGYLVQAMLLRNGDAYFAARDLLGEAPWWRLALGALGMAIYGGAVAATSRGLKALWPDLVGARRVAKTSWLAAVLGVAAAALLYRGVGASRGLHDALTEIGLASVPLLLIPRGSSVAAPSMAARLALRPAILALAAAVFVLFAATQGLGLRA